MRGEGWRRKEKEGLGLKRTLVEGGSGCGGKENFIYVLVRIKRIKERRPGMESRWRTVWGRAVWEASRQK